jgi:hypothetical protein
MVETPIAAVSSTHDDDTTTPCLRSGRRQTELPAQIRALPQRISIASLDGRLAVGAQMIEAGRPKTDASCGVAKPSWNARW